MKEYLLTAQDILEEGSRKGAHRVVFASKEDKTIVKATAEELNRAIKWNDAFSFKYKLQKLENEKYVDIEKYKRIFDYSVASKIFFSSVKKGSLCVAKSVFEDISSFDLKMSAFITRRLLSDVLIDQDKKYDPLFIEQVIKFFKTISSSGCSSLKYVTYAKSYLLGYAEIAAVLRGKCLDEKKARGVFKKLASLKEIEEKGGSSEAALYNLMGQVSSTYDRELAVRCFENAKHIDKDGVIEFFYRDMGIYTYFSLGNSDEDIAVELVSLIKKAIRWDSGFVSRSNTKILISMDINFFRIYSPFLLFFAQQLPDYDFYFLMVGQDDLREVKEISNNYLRSLNNVNRSGVPTNVCFGAAEVPSFVGNEKTFYACARFFAVEMLMKCSDDLIFVMDADIFITENLEPIFCKMRNKLSLPKNPRVSSVSPWRRYMAGNIGFSVAEGRGKLFVSLIEKYTALGLQEKRSWMLDQNALDYAVSLMKETHFFDLNGLKKPFAQLPFRSTWEKRYFSHG